jgi:uncharacterized protein YgiM (DUF1202 family)
MNLNKTKMHGVRLSVLTAVTIVIVSLLMVNKTVVASNADYVSVLNAGAATIIDAEINVESEEMTELRLLAEEENAKPKSTLVISNVNNSLNVRAEGNIDAEIVGKMYQYCGGTILEQADGWTKFQSGDLVGWASDEYLLFDEEASAKAEEIGELQVTVIADALRIRTEATLDSKVAGVVPNGEILEGVETFDDWVGVYYDDKEQFVSAEYVEVSRKLPQGETKEEIEKREQELLAQKLALNTNNGIYEPAEGDLDLLAAIIYCEARGESYEGKIAVGAVVLNRVRSARFPNSIRDVIYSPGQFSPVLSGKYEQVLAAGSTSAECYQAAQEALDGKTTVGTYLFFRRAGSKSGYILGNHVFY